MTEEEQAAAVEGVLSEQVQCSQCRQWFDESAVLMTRDICVGCWKHISEALYALKLKHRLP
jgi:hypothetical protein